MTPKLAKHQLGKPFKTQSSSLLLMPILSIIRTGLRRLSIFHQVKRTLCPIMALVILALNANALDLTKQDFTYLYDPYSPVRIRHKITQLGNDFTLYIMLNLKNPLRPENAFNIDLLAQNGYKDKKEIVLDTDLVKRDSTRRLILFKYEFNVQPDYDLLVGSFLINNVYYYYDIPINGSLEFPLPEVVPLKENGWPYFDYYIQKGTKLDFDREVYTFQYNDQFGTARPPMSSGGESKPNIIKIDTSFKANSYTVEREQILSFVQTDSSSNSGCSFLTVSPYFPKFRRVDDLAKTILYLCKTEEYDAIQSAKEKKKAFDRFWISVIASRDRARSVLKRYYNNVTLANSLFTDYKEGWRTDRGMILIIYGYPREVVRTDEEEIWTYSINGKKQNFNFAKVPNLFVQHHYVLIRDKDLSKVWLNEVGKWRKGNM